MKKTNSIFLAFSILLVIICFTNVSAFGVTSPYWSERPLELSPGETKEMGLGLQNMIGTENVTVVAEITRGSEIAEITDENTEYFVPLGSQNVVGINIKITIPEDAEIDTEYVVSVTITTVTPGEKGAVAMGSSIKKDFPVLVKSSTAETTEEETVLSPWAIAGIAAIIVVLVIILLLKKKKSKKK